MHESEVKKELKRIMTECYDEELAAVMILGIEQMSEADAEKALGDLLEVLKSAPKLLKMTDDLIRDSKASHIDHQQQTP